MILSDYMKELGAIGIEFINQSIISKHKGVIKFLLKKIGSNILSGKSIMNVSLPIYIFDQRSLLERYFLFYFNLYFNIIYFILLYLLNYFPSFAYEFKLANAYLEKTKNATDVDKMKYVYKTNK
jgi:hypothetical protein